MAAPEKKIWKKPSVRYFGSAEEARAFYASKYTPAELAAISELFNRFEAKLECSEPGQKGFRQQRNG